MNPSSLLSFAGALALLSLPAAAQTQLAPFGTPNPPSFSSTTGTPGAAGGGCGTMDDFETYTVSSGGAENILSTVLDDQTVTGTGQGPGLVIDGVTYSCLGNSLQWNGPGWFGQPTKNFLANSGDSTLTITYDTPANDVCMDLHAFDGFGDTATLVAYDAAGTALDTQTIGIPDSVAVPYSVSVSGISSIVVSGTYSWSPIIDNHEFCSGPGVFTMTVNGLVAGGTAQLSTNNGTPGGVVGMAYSIAGGGPSTASAGSCGAVTADLSAPIKVIGIFANNGSGSASTSANVPAGTTGVSVWFQALDVGSCTLSNGLAMTIG